MQAACVQGTYVSVNCLNSLCPAFQFIRERVGTLSEAFRTNRRDCLAPWSLPGGRCSHSRVLERIAVQCALSPAAPDMRRGVLDRPCSSSGVEGSKEPFRLVSLCGPR